MVAFLPRVTARPGEQPERPLSPDGSADATRSSAADFANATRPLASIAARLASAASPAQAAPWLTALVLATRPAVSTLPTEQLRAHIAALAHGAPPPSSASTNAHAAPRTSHAPTAHTIQTAVVLVEQQEV